MNNEIIEQIIAQRQVLLRSLLVSKHDILVSPSDWENKNLGDFYAAMDELEESSLVQESDTIEVVHVVNS
jgi:hypothetical protein